MTLEETSRENHTSNNFFYFTGFVQNSLHCNIDLHGYGGQKHNYHRTLHSGTLNSMCGLSHSAITQILEPRRKVLISSLLYATKKVASKIGNFIIAHSNVRNTEGDNFVMALICFLFENYILFLYEMEQFKTVGDSFSQLCLKDINYQVLHRLKSSFVPCQSVDRKAAAMAYTLKME